MKSSDQINHNALPRFCVYSKLPGNNPIFCKYVTWPDKVHNPEMVYRPGNINFCINHCCNKMKRLPSPYIIMWNVIRGYVIRMTYRMHVK